MKLISTTAAADDGISVASVQRQFAVAFTPGEVSFTPAATCEDLIGQAAGPGTVLLKRVSPDPQR